MPDFCLAVKTSGVFAAFACEIFALRMTGSVFGKFKWVARQCTNSTTRKANDHQEFTVRHSSFFSKRQVFDHFQDFHDVFRTFSRFDVFQVLSRFDVFHVFSCSSSFQVFDVVQVFQVFEVFQVFHVFDVFHVLSRFDVFHVFRVFQVFFEIVMKTSK
jgi:hypothetical protein